jgi:hypothetical protein
MWPRSLRSGDIMTDGAASKVFGLGERGFQRRHGEAGASKAEVFARLGGFKAQI